MAAKKTVKKTVKKQPARVQILLGSESDLPVIEKMKPLLDRFHLPYRIDVASARQLRQLIADLHQQGTTIFLTTHYIEEAEEIADRIAVINRGQILLVEEKARLMARMGQKELRIDNLILPIDHLATRIYSQNREVAILEWLSLSSYYYWGSYDIVDQNSSTNVTKSVHHQSEIRSPAKVFTANNTPYFINHLEGKPSPTETLCASSQKFSALLIRTMSDSPTLARNASRLEPRCERLPTMRTGSLLVSATRIGVADSAVRNSEPWPSQPM